MSKYNDIAKSFDKPTKSDNSAVSVKLNNSNVVSGETLREIQSNTLKEVAQYLSKTFGPMGSNTKIITGNNASEINTSYSKDGLKVLKHIMSSKPIEMSIIEELIEITRSVEKEVGDGTTSTVILTSFIFDNLIDIQDKFNVTPYQIIDKFKAVVEEVKENIMKNKHECTLEDIYDIAMISTNGNTDVSLNIQNIYEDYGLDVDITLGISNTKDSQLKIYDGLLITEGYDSPAYINNAVDNSCEIRNAHIYYFCDPINTGDMIGYFESIMEHNIYEPLREDEDMIPTVICCPQITRDLSANLKKLEQMMYQYDAKGSTSNKPPVLIISNIVASDAEIMDDIANLCGCKTIAKYIDPEVHKRDAEAGLAPTFENAYEFYGTAELVVADSKKTKFINPPHKNEDDQIYKSMVNFLEGEIQLHKDENNANELGKLKKRLSALKANMVEYFVGGVTIADRDALKDLIEDAVKNCRSAAKDGVGYAANYEALRASYEIYEQYKEEDDTSIECAIAKTIFASYYDIEELLYSTVCTDKDTIEKAIEISIDTQSGPYNIREGLHVNCDDSSDVLCSIMLDINILDTISKIVTIMVTCNQCLLQAPNLNTY